MARRHRKCRRHRSNPRGNDGTGLGIYLTAAASQILFGSGSTLGGSDSRGRFTRRKLTKLHRLSPSLSFPLCLSAGSGGGSIRKESKTGTGKRRLLDLSVFLATSSLTLQFSLPTRPRISPSPGRIQSHVFWWRDGRGHQHARALGHYLR